jgi:hypothetical protein
MEDFQPGRQKLKELTDSHQISKEKQKELFEILIPPLERIISAIKKQIKSRQRNTYAKAASNSIIHTLLNGSQWYNGIMKKHAEDQLIIREIINGQNNQDLYNNYIKSLTYFIYKKYNYFGWAECEEMAKDSWQEAMVSIIRQKFILTSSFEAYIKTVAQNMVRSLTKKYVLKKQFATEILTNSDFDSEFDFDEEFYDPYQVLLSELDAIIIKKIETLSSQCKSFIKIRYGLEDPFLYELESIKEYSIEHQPSNEKNIKLTSIKKAASLVGIKPVSANKYSQTCTDSLILRCQEEVSGLLDDYARRLPSQIANLRELLEQKFKASRNRYNTHKEANKLYKIKTRNVSKS